MLETLQGKKDEVMVIEDIVSESSVKRIPAVEDGWFSRRKEVKHCHLLPVVETSRVINNGVRGKEMVFYVWAISNSKENKSKHLQDKTLRIFENLYETWKNHMNQRKIL